MNYFAHGRRFIEDPYLVAGTAVPDWLNVVDRRVRARSKAARMHVADPDPRVAAVARGVVQHHHDDHWFHQTRAFNELNWEMTLRIRRKFPSEEGLRASFLGHILVELLLDASLIADAPRALDAYYEALGQVDPSAVAAAVEQISGRPVARLALLVPRFCTDRFLYDYLEDGKLWTRVNAVLKRVQLPSLPTDFPSILPEARQLVAARRDELLEGESGSTSNLPENES